MWTASWQTMGPFTWSFCNKNIGRSLDKVSIVSSEIGRLRKCEGEQLPPRSSSNRRTGKVQLDKRGERKYRKRPVLCAVSARYFVISLRNQGNSETLQEKTEEFLYDFYDSAWPALPSIFWNFLLNATSFRFLACEPEVDGSRLILHWMETLIEWLLLNIFFRTLPDLLEMNFIYIIIVYRFVGYLYL